MPSTEAHRGWTGSEPEPVHDGRDVPFITHMRSEHTDDLRAQAEYARQRYQLYKAKAYGQRPTSPVRMRELERTWQQAETRLRAAEAEERDSLDRDDDAREAR